MNVTIDPTLDWGETGATLYYAVYNAAGGTVVARTNTGVTEHPSGSGQYHVNNGITVDSAVRQRIVWDDGITYVGESLDGYIAAAVGESVASGATVIRANDASGNALATSAQATTITTQTAAIKVKTDNLPDEPASKDDVQVTVQPTTLDSTAVNAIRDGLATSEQVSQITDKLPSSAYLAGSDSEDGAVTVEVGELEAKQDQLIALFQSGLPDVGPGQQRGARRVVKGDTYSSTGRQLLITKHKNADWPTDLSEWTWAFTASKHPDNENDGDALAGSVSVATATGDNRGLRISLTKEQTAAAAVGRHLYAVRGTNVEDDSLVWTVELGVVDVEEAATE